MTRIAYLAPMKSRVLLPFGVSLVLLVLAIGTLVYRMIEGPRRASSDANEGGPRVPVHYGNVPDAPVPTERPFVGPADVGPDRYPLRTSDGAALLALLHARRFDELTRYVEQAEADAERDWHMEFWAIDAIERLGNGDPNNGPLLDAWVAASPASFVPLAVRGSHAIELGATLRGNATAGETSEEAMAAMHRQIRLAVADLERAIAFRPLATVVERLRIRASTYVSDDRLRELARTRAELSCPMCTGWRATYLVAIEPRWGGEPGATERFLVESERLVTTNPRLAHLRGQTRIESSGRGFAERLASSSAALTHGEFWAFYLERGRAYLGMRDYAHAVADADRANALRPGHPAVLELRTAALFNARRFFEAAEVLIDALRLDPGDPTLGERIARTINGVRWAAEDAMFEGDPSRVARATELATWLDPADVNTVRLRGPTTEAAPRFQALVARIRAEPESFEAVRDLDTALAHHQEWDRIVAAWDDFIRRHPDDANAYFERGGTQHHRGQPAACEADLRRACALGRAAACPLAERCR